jgi:hypothetical protein
MSARVNRGRFLFPKWANKVFPIVLVLGGGGATAGAAALGYYGSTAYLEVGYTPKQPVPYSHKLHAGELGIDCRYCHSTVERSAFSQVPPVQTCMNCHTKVKTDSLKLLPVREAYAKDDPLKWTLIHNLPDFVYFNHSAHLASGVGCSSCHGRVDQMVQVSQVAPLSMGWCLDCHRNPAPAIRDPADVTKMDWKPSPEQLASTDPHPPLKNGRKANPPTNCSGCHR